MLIAMFRSVKFAVSLLLAVTMMSFQMPCLTSDAEKLGTAAPGQILRSFTVEDSIESTHFVQPLEASGEHPPLSPDGKRFFVVTERGILALNQREFSLSIFELGRLQSQATRIAVFRTSSNRPGIVNAKWIDNETISLVGENPGKSPQLYVVNCASHKLRKLTTAPRGVAAYDVTSDLKTVVYYSPWGGDESENKKKEEHGFAVSDENLSDLVNGTWKDPDQTFQMWILNTASGKARKVNAPPFAMNHLLLNISLSPDGQYAVSAEPPLFISKDWVSYEGSMVEGAAKVEGGKIHKIRHPFCYQVMLTDIQTGNLQPLLDAPLQMAFTLAAWMPDSRSVIVGPTLLPLDANSSTEVARRRKNPAAVEVSVPERAFQRVIDLPGGEFWNGFTTGNSPGTFVINLSQQKPGGSWAKAPSRQYRKQGQDWVQDKSFVERGVGSDIEISEANDRWPKLVQRHPSTKKETVILDPNPQFKKLRFGREEIIRWVGNLGQPLVGGLLYPPDYTPGTRYPLVIQTYQLNENGFLLDGPSSTAYAAQALVNHNVFVLQLSESPLYRATIFTPDFGRTELSQIDSAVDYLDHLGLIDPERVGLVGFSIKGFQVTYAITHSKYHFAAATSAEGNDWGYWSYLVMGNYANWIRQVESQFGGPPWNGNWKPWMQQSITFNYDKIHTPLRLESNMGDQAAILNEWENFIALKRLGRPVDLIFQSHGDHPVVKPWERMTSQQGNVDWMMFWLKGEEDADPAKTEQYARWRELKKLQEAEKD